MYMFGLEGPELPPPILIAVCMLLLVPVLMEPELETKSGDESKRSNGKEGTKIRVSKGNHITEAVEFGKVGR